MKAYKALEKLYLNIDGDGIHYYTQETPIEREYIEYIRTDAFIKKTCEWIKEKWGDNYTMPIIIDSVIDEFKNYIKEE